MDGFNNVLIRIEIGFLQEHAKYQIRSGKTPV